MRGKETARQELLERLSCLRPGLVLQYAWKDRRTGKSVNFIHKISRFADRRCRSTDEEHYGEPAISRPGPSAWQPVCRSRPNLFNSGHSHILKVKIWQDSRPAAASIREQQASAVSSTVRHTGAFCSNRREFVRFSSMELAWMSLDSKKIFRRTLRHKDS